MYNAKAFFLSAIASSQSSPHQEAGRDVRLGEKEREGEEEEEEAGKEEEEDAVMD